MGNAASGTDTLSSGPPDEPERAPGGERRAAPSWLRSGLIIPVVIAALLGLGAGYLIGLSRSTAPADPAQTTAGSIRLRATDGSSELTDLGNKISELQLVIANDGRSPVRIRSIGTSSPGLVLFQTTYFVEAGISVPPPVDVDPGGSITVIFSFRITFCGAALAVPPRLPVQVDTRDGVRTVQIEGTEPYLQEWQNEIGGSRAC